MTTMPENPLRVMIAGDLPFLRYAPTCIASIRANTTGPIDVGVVTNGVSEAVKQKLVDACPGVTLHFREINTDSLSGVSTTDLLNEMSYARILMPKLVDWDRFVYLDIDVIVQSDLRKLSDLDLHGSPLAAAVQGHLGINTGVLVVDAEMWRRENLEKTLIEYAMTHKLEKADQDAIIAVIGDRILEFDVSWNTPAELMWTPEEKLSDATLDQADILHYITGFKPWSPLVRWLGNQLLLARWDR